MMDVGSVPNGSDLPAVIQGGMGVGVSGWRLARAVARTGQLGVVSGVALDALLTRRLQQGDAGGHLRRALAHFPVSAVAERVLQRYFVPGGLPEGRPFRPVPRLGLRTRRHGQELAVVANFVEVFLAKEGHDGRVGVNYLEKVQLATPAALYGAMLAGVDYVLMGAGLPTEIPRLLDTLAANAPGRLSVAVHGVGTGEQHQIIFDPRELLGELPLPRRTGRGLRTQGRLGRRHGRQPVPVQRPGRHRGARPTAAGRLPRATPGDARAGSCLPATPDPPRRRLQRRGRHRVPARAGRTDRIGP